MVRLVASGVVGLALVIGCSSGSPGSGGGSAFKTMVDGNKPLAGLSAEDRAALCADIQSYAAGTLAPDTCRLYALNAVLESYPDYLSVGDSDLETACSAAYQKCLSSIGKEAGSPVQDGGLVMMGPSGNSDGGQIGQCESSLAAVSCETTVSAYSRCLSEEDVLYRSLPSCGQLTSKELNAVVVDGGIAVGQSASCSDLANCMLSIM
jgi:hypothetical protein